MNPDQLSEEQILHIVNETDAELFRAGVEINRRRWEVPHHVMQRLGCYAFVVAGVGKPQVLERIEAAFRSIYRKQDFAMGGHIGVFMYRDVFARIAVPQIFGPSVFNPLQFVDLSPVQLRNLQNGPDEMGTFLDQICDVTDVEYGSGSLNLPFAKMELVGRFIGRARTHLHAAAAILTGGYDCGGAVQTAVLATELALKSAAAAQGLGEDEIRKRFRHDLRGLVDFAALAWSAFDSARVQRVISCQPDYVRNRYSSAQPDRLVVGHRVMGAQFIVAEVVLQLSDRDFRTGLNPPVARRYPG